MVINSCSIKKLLVQMSGGSIGCVCEAIGNSESPLLGWGPGHAGFLPGSGLTLLMSLLSWGERVGEENTLIRCGICCCDWGGSPPVGEQSPGEQAGVVVVYGSPAERSGMSCPAAGCWSCIAPSKVDSAGEEAGIQLQVELVRNLP